MKRFLSLLLLTVGALGCQEKPEIAFEEYGETSATLPVVDNVPEIFEIPEAAESRTCVIREQALNSARSERAYETNVAKKAAQNADSQAK